MQDVLVMLVVCGAPLTLRAADLITELSAQDWRVSVVGTPSSTSWLDAEAVARLTGEAPRTDFRSPSEPKWGGTPSAVVICPATFNTVNKAATGITDTFAAGVICEALGNGVPTILVPMVNDKLWGHPAWPGNLDILKRAGVVLVDIASGGPVPAPVASGTGGQIVVNFDPSWLTNSLARVLS